MGGKARFVCRAVVIIIVALLLCNVAQGQSGSDRPGRDYKNFDLPQTNPDLCRKACDDDPNCKAWTYVRPGFQGATARCWLKSGVPRAVKNDCCISGIKRSAPDTTETVTGSVLNAGKVMAATGCIDWNQPPPGITFGLKHSTNQADKRLFYAGGDYDPAATQSPPGIVTRQNGGDLGGSGGEGFYWYETSGIEFPFAKGPLNTQEGHQAWQAFVSKLPAGLVFGLTHSVNQRGKGLVWLPEPQEFRPWQFTTLDPVNPSQAVPWPFERQNGGDYSGSSGQGFYWYEVRSDTQSGDCEASLPGGLVFGLKHSLNQPNKKFRWRGTEYDAAQRGGPIPSGFVRCQGGDLGAPSGQGYCWFETIGHGTFVQRHLGVSCEGHYREPF